MQQVPPNILERFLSSDRLGSYLRMANGDHTKAVALYLENLEQCQRFYTALHWLEIGLRNAMNRQLTVRYGDAWYDNRHLGLGTIEQQQIQKARDTLMKAGKPTGNGDMVAALNFGFWVNLFNNPYDDLWRFCLRKAFPGCATPLQRKEMRSKLHPMLRLRNRIAHYEPILSHDLATRRQDIIDIIRWIEPDMPELP